MVIEKVTEQDVRKIEDMLLLKHLVPYQPFGSRSRAHKVLYIMTPILFCLSIGCYYIKNYVMFWIGLIVTIWSLIWIIWYHLIGVKREKKVYDTIHHAIENAMESGKKLEFHQEGISMEGDKKDIQVKYAIFYDPFVLLVTMKKEVIILKIDTKNKSELIDILSKYGNIEVQEKDKPFNIYGYLK